MRHAQETLPGLAYMSFQFQKALYRALSAYAILCEFASQLELNIALSLSQAQQRPFADLE